MASVLLCSWVSSTTVTFTDPYILATVEYTYPVVHLSVMCNWRLVLPSLLHVLVKNCGILMRLPLHTVIHVNLMWSCVSYQTIWRRSFGVSTRYLGLARNSWYNSRSEQLKMLFTRHFHKKYTTFTSSLIIRRHLFLQSGMVTGEWIE